MHARRVEDGLASGFQREVVGGAVVWVVDDAVEALERGGDGAAVDAGLVRLGGGAVVDHPRRDGDAHARERGVRVRGMERGPGDGALADAHNGGVELVEIGAGVGAVERADRAGELGPDAEVEVVADVERPEVVGENARAHAAAELVEEDVAGGGEGLDGVGVVPEAEGVV